MKRYIKKLLQLLGVANLKLFVLTIFHYPDFIKDFLHFKKLYNKSASQRFKLNYIDLKPCIHDKTTNTGFDRHYVFHTAWAARKIKAINPKIHYDFSSSVYFNALVSAFVPIKFFDYRPAIMDLSDLSSEHVDLCQLPFKDNSLTSLSCMHVVEHVGLGRYGDPIDIDGDLKAIKELKRVVKEDGDLLFVIPIGENKIMYNAHRIYSYEQIISYFDDFNLIEFSLIQDDGYGGNIINNATKELADMQEYGCGMFWFKKKS